MSTPRPPYPGHSWFFNHHAPCYDPDTFISVLRIALGYHGKSGVGNQITDDVAKAGLLTLNIRRDAGRPQTWRDYQQAFAELGAICSTRLTNGKILVTPMGKALLDGETDFPQFVTAQALGYQYPNGLHLDVARRQVTSGLCIKPFLLLLQVLRALQKAGQIPYLTREEIQRVVAYEKDNSRPNGVAQEIIRFRTSRKRLPPRVGNTRNFSDIIWVLDRSTVFRRVETPSPSLTFRRTDSRFIELIDRFIQVESDQKTYYSFRTGSENEGLAWFAHYGSYARLENLSDPMEQVRTTALQDAEDETASIAALSQTPSLVEMIEPPKPVSESRPPLAPTVEQLLASQELKEKARKGHMELVALMYSKVKNAGSKPFEDKKGVDLFTKVSGRPYYFEMKAGHKANWLGHVRRGMAQLYEYSYRYEGNNRNPDVVLCLVLSSAPDFPDWFLKYLIVDRSVHICWKEGQAFKCPPRSQTVLQPFL